LEDALGLNKNSSDTDKDGYNDNIELINGYSPWDSGKQSIDNNFAKAQAGKIFLQVEKNGEAWYINPDDNKRYFLGRPNDSFNIMRNLGLGITDANLANIASVNIEGSIKAGEKENINLDNERIIDNEDDNCPNCGEYEIPDCGNGILKYQGMDKCGCPIPPICKETDENECSTCPSYTLPVCPNGVLIYQGKDDCGCFLTPLCDESLIDDDSENLVPELFDSCTKDSDCCMVSLDCCGCTAGGMATVINPYYLDVWNQTILGGCEDYSCVAVISQHISCFSDVKCVAGKCTLEPNSGKVCSSDLYSNCQGVEGDELTETKDEYGTSCQEILDICE